MKSQQDDIGMVGLGVMGRNLLVNMAEHGFSVAGYDVRFCTTCQGKGRADDIESGNIQ